MNCLLSYEQLEVSYTVVVCIYLCAEDVYCISRTLQVSGMCCFKKRNKYNSTKGNTLFEDECKTIIRARQGT